MNNKPTPIRVLIIGILFGTLFMTALAIADWNDTRGSYLISASEWSRGEGVIVSSSVWSQETKNGTVYHYLIKYRFELAKKLYYSSQVNFSATGFKDRESAYYYKQKYPVSNKVKIYYLSRDPRFSVLEPEKKDTFLSSLFWAYLLSIAVVFFIVLIQWHQKERAAK